jgi:hypothetical protein
VLLLLLPGLGWGFTEMALVFLFMLFNNGAAAIRL